MAEVDKIKRQSNMYILQCCLLFVILKGLAEFAASYFGISELLSNPLSLASIFCILTGCVIGTLWKWIAKNNEEMLTTFYSATNAFRMLLGLATLTTCYFIVGSENIKPYVIVFMVFYLIAIVHHAIYFARITNNK